MSWVDDEVSEADSEEQDDGDNDESTSSTGSNLSQFEQQLKTLIDTGSVGISERILEDQLTEADNVELLEEFKQSLINEEEPDKAGMVHDRLVELGAAENDDDEVEADVEPVEDDTDSSTDNESEDVQDDTGTDETDTVDDSGSTEETSDDGKTTGGLLDGVDLNNSSGITVKDAGQLNKRWSVLVWGPPGLGKTHYAFTAPEPVMFIDTEGKGHHLADKFDDREIMMWQPDSYDEAKDALNEALDILQQVKRNTDQIGTVVVDSMSKMWEWSQQKHADKFYGGQEVSEVQDEFQSAMGSGPSDWQRIKRYHNAKFRQPMVQSPFHLVWTAMRDRDYNAAITEDTNFTPKKPAGEKDNEYQVTEVVRLSENDEGRPAGELEKSDKTKFHYEGLEFPTFPKHRKAVQDLALLESGEKERLDIINEHGIQISEGNPRRLRLKEDDD